MKKFFLILLLVLIINGGIAFLIISLLRSDKEPELEYKYSVLENELSEVNFEIRFRVESPERKGNGLFSKPTYYNYLCLNCKDNQVEYLNDNKGLNSEECVDVNENDNLSIEAKDILLQSDYVDKIFTETKKIDDYPNVIDANPYVIAFQSENENGKPGRNVVIYIYEKDNKEIVFVSTIELNENYCFPASHYGYLVIKNVAIKK